jgi:diadenosine tetraphosphate (Ap4A) HIT family hydrolase
MASTAIHPQLALDTHDLGSLGNSRVLLHRNATVPWFILVPDTAVGDLLDLPSGMLSSIMEEAALISQFVKGAFHCVKVNFASIGNIVPQLHLHIVGRKSDDPCWPAPVWGNLRHTRDYSADELARIVEQLSHHAAGRFSAQSTRSD